MLSGMTPRGVSCRQRKPHPLEGFLVLAVAPFLGHDDIQALRRTCATSRRTLDAYERSTARASIRRTPLSGPAPTHHLLTTAAPTWTSTADADAPRQRRAVAPCASYAALRELEAREREIAFLVDASPYLRAGLERAGIKPTCAAETRRVRAALKRALWLCDGIADLETAGWATYDAVPACRRHGQRHAGEGEGEGEARASAARVRNAQLAAVQALPARDLAALVVLGDLATRGFEDLVLGKRRMEEYPRHVVAEWSVAVAENVYRHGIFFLRGQARRGSASRGRGRTEAFAAAAVCDVVREMHAWEAGDEETLPGLNMTIRRAFRAQVECEPDEAVWEAVRVMMGRESEDKK